MATNDLVLEYVDRLKHHDWYHEDSEDYSVWKRGRSELAELEALQAQVDPDFHIWNGHAPEQFQRHKKIDVVVNNSDAAEIVRRALGPPTEECRAIDLSGHKKSDKATRPPAAPQPKKPGPRPPKP